MDTVPGCSAFACNDRRTKGYEMFRFPSDPARRKIWKNKVHRMGWEPISATVLWEVYYINIHFFFVVEI